MNTSGQELSVRQVGQTLFDFISLEEALRSATLFLKMRRRDWRFYATLRESTLHLRPR
jgi:hypothetical protein